LGDAKACIDTCAAIVEQCGSAALEGEEDAVQRFVEEGAIESILAVLDRHKGNHDVQLQGLRALGALAREEYITRQVSKETYYSVKRDLLYADF
jgi:hypothetical protein